MNKYVIAIVTYKRPQMLRELLLKLKDIQMYDSTLVLIVDNDELKSAYRVYEEISSSTDNLIYVCEPAKGLANVRNRALKEAFTYSDNMLFIDDDEIPHENWLVNMLRCKEAFKASVVIGPVLKELRAKKRYVTEAFFEHPNPTHSFYMKSGGRTGNCLISKEILNFISNPPFNPQFNETGGEDLDFFTKLHKSNVKVAWAHDAYATEIITPDRITLRYGMKRKFYVAATNFSITHQDETLLKHLFIVFRGLSAGITKLLLSLGIFENLAAGGLISLARASGRLYGILKFYGLFKKRSDSIYKKTTGF